jgi:ATP-dependent protease ClpP protease subunit
MHPVASTGGSALRLFGGASGTMQFIDSDVATYGMGMAASMGSSC